MVELRKLLRLLLDKKAARLTLLAGKPPLLRLEGKDHPLNLAPLRSYEIDLYLRAIRPEGLPESEEFELPLPAPGRFRATVRGKGATRSVTFQPLT